uniref:Uncharacterized protein n=1 Tax=Timema poppense TaxID=170557 RepID=A0A7R9HAN7_TIMPO|nr:unnamed protein product [Timema poppensis]
MELNTVPVKPQPTNVLTGAQTWVINKPNTMVRLPSTRKHKFLQYFLAPSFRNLSRTFHTPSFGVKIELNLGRGNYSEEMSQPKKNLLQWEPTPLVKPFDNILLGKKNFLPFVPSYEKTCTGSSSSSAAASYHLAKVTAPTTITYPNFNNQQGVRTRINLSAGSRPHI